MEDARLRPLPTDKLGFYIASGDQDLLTQVNRLMSRSGYVGVMDTAGRIQYVIDGRKGGPHATRRILETTDRILEDRQNADQALIRQLAPAVDQVLAIHAVRQELKGCRFLRYLLLTAGLDETRLRPISKTLYPLVARHYHASVSQIERDIRYALQKSDFQGKRMTGTAIISGLYNEMISRANALLQQAAPKEGKEMPPVADKGEGGHPGNVTSGS